MASARGRTSGKYKGVYASGKEGQYMIRITIDGIKEIHGPYASEVEAAKAFDRKKIEKGKEPLNFPRSEYSLPETPASLRKAASKKAKTTPQPTTPASKPQKASGKTPVSKEKKPSSPKKKTTATISPPKSPSNMMDGGKVCLAISALFVIAFLGVAAYGWYTEEFTLSGLYGELKNTLDWEGMYSKTKHVKGNVFGYVLRLIKKEEL